MAAEYFSNDARIGFTVREYAFHGVIHRVELMKGAVQRTNPSATGTDERLVDIEKKQLHARIVLRVHGFLYRCR